MHAVFEGLDLEFAGVEEFLQVKFAIFEGSLGRLCSNVSRILEFDALRTTATRSTTGLMIVAVARA